MIQDGQFPRTIVMTGATGAVGSICARQLAAMPEVARLTLIGRRPAEGVAGLAVVQHIANVTDASAYPPLVRGHTAAVCTLGVGQPSKVSREEFLRIDKQAALAFAVACRAAGVQHFSLLCSVGANARSSNYYLRAKGELEEDLIALAFPRLSLFEPSVILTPTNRYGISQGLLLAVMPWLNELLVGPLRQYRGIKVETLGRAIANNVMRSGAGVERLQFDQITLLGA
jgi:uncharacterized protein YbjT (DUF2867 family)